MTIHQDAHEDGINISITGVLDLPDLHIMLCRILSSEENACRTIKLDLRFAVVETANTEEIAHFVEFLVTFWMPRLMAARGQFVINAQKSPFKNDTCRLVNALVELEHSTLTVNIADSQDDPPADDVILKGPLSNRIDMLIDNETPNAGISRLPVVSEASAVA